MPKPLLEHEARDLLKKRGIPVLDYQFCLGLEETLAAADRLGYPVVLKVVSPQVVHKTETGGVKLDLKTPDEVENAYAQILQSVEKYAPGAEIKGFLVSPMVRKAQELIVGAITDPQFGPAIMVGLGGIFVEVFKDVSFGLAPIDNQEAQEMLERLQSYPLIQGVRGKPGLDQEKIKDLIVKVSQFAYEESVQELDLNPVFCYPDKILVGDARILWQE